MTFGKGRNDWRACLFGALCVLATSAVLTSPANAGAPMGFAGSLEGDYSHASLDCSGCGSANIWGGAASGAFGLGTNDLAIGADGGYHHLSASGVGVNVWNINGNIFWAPGSVRAGGSVGYTTVDTSGLTGHVTNYGAFGEWFASNAITLGIKGGGLSADVSFLGYGSLGSTTGSYVGGGANVYVMPNLSLAGTIDHYTMSDFHITNFTAAAEYLVSESFPVSLTAGYTYSEFNLGIPHANQFFIGVKIYTQGNGTTLVDKHRNGPMGSIGSLGLKTFF